jgi:hypothetical protein
VNIFIVESFFDNYDSNDPGRKIRGITNGIHARLGVKS